MKKLLIIGGGAIGRAYLPWVFPPDEFLYWYIDINEYISNRLRRPGGTTYMIQGSGYNVMKIKSQINPPVEFDAVLTAVGPRAFMGLVDMFINTRTPIICCENDSRLPKRMSELTGNPNIYFAIPDVIASNTAPQRLKDIDPLAIISENGICYIDEAMKDLGGRAVYLDKEGMRREWMAKLYIHNTPHCIAAYMGYQKHATLMSDALEDEEIRNTVWGAMNEMIGTIHTIYGIDKEFASQYAAKEIARFSNHLLHDPISRVAREPLRKLAKDDRLIGAAALCLQAGGTPTNILKGIRAAMRYIHPRDPDYRIMKRINKMSEFLGMMGINPDEPIYNTLMEEEKR